jgi:Uma2 family endonuclease
MMPKVVEVSSGTGVIAMTIILDEKVRIPPLRDLAAFRRWARSEAFPDRGHFSWLDGELWVDTTMERVNHNQAKNAITTALTVLAHSQRLGRIFADRMLLSCEEAGLSTEPDALFVGHEALTSGLVRLVDGDESLEVEGTPDMVLEVVSATSVHKDTEVLRDLYWRANIPEYWLVDPRKDPATFEVLRHTKRGYVATRSQAGWLKSAVFGTAFRLVQGVDPHGVTEFNLEVR